jgi:hypothetical protein
MKKITQAIVGSIVALGLIGAVTGCTETTSEKQYQKLDSQSDKRIAPKSSDTEYNNYMKAQKLYGDPNTILWCSASFNTASSPIFTVPIAGKLTSSSVSFYPGQHVDYSSNGNLLVESRSVDGMYHGSPAPYRYAFTPGGQYVDFTDLAMFCSTSLTEFQQQSLKINVSQSEADAVTEKAKEQLKSGDKKGAQSTLDNLTGTK